MDGVLPISFSFGADSARLIGAEVRSSLIDVIRPPLGEIGSQIRTLTRSLLDMVGQLYWLQSRSHVHLHQIIDAINALRGTTLTLAYSTSVTGGSQYVVLVAILDALRRGIVTQGTFTLVISAGGLGDFLEKLDLLKLLGLLGILALALAVIVAFLYGVGRALASFGVNAIAAATAIALLIGALTPLIEKLVGYDWEQIAKIGVAFALIGGFVYGLGRAFAVFRSDLDKITGPLEKFFASLSGLISKLSGLDWAQVGRIGAAFAGIAAFVLVLGVAFDAVRSDLDKIVGPLDSFFASIVKLMDRLGGFNWSQLGRIGAAFAGIALFILLLGLALDAVRKDLDKVVGPLDAFFVSIVSLMDKLGGFNWSQLGRIGAAFAGIALFVFLLGKAFNAFRADLGKITGPLDKFFTSIMKLIDRLGAVNWGQLARIALGFAAIALFTYALGKAFNAFRGDLAKITGPLNQFLASIMGLVDRLGAINWGQLARIALGFAAIALFTYGLGKAFNAFRGDLGKVTKPLNQFLASIMGLVDRLAAINWGQLARIALGFAAIALFTYGLGKAFNAFRGDLAKITGPLNQFLASLMNLLDRLVGFNWAQMGIIGAAFLGIALFVWLLGKAFNAFRSDLVKVTGPLDAFFNSIMGLINKLVGFNWAQMGIIGAAFLGIAVFIWILGAAFNTFRDDLGTILGPLDEFFRIIGALMERFAAFSLAQMGAIVVGLLAVALFVYGLAMALNSLNAQAVAAIPALVQMLGMLAMLAGMFAMMSGGQLGMMAIGLAIIVGVVWLLAAALVFASGPLASLGAIFEGVSKIIDTVTVLVKGFIDLISSIGSLISSLFGSGEIEAHIEHATTVATDAKHTISAAPDTIRSASLGVSNLGTGMSDVSKMMDPSKMGGMGGMDFSKMGGMGGMDFSKMGGMGGMDFSKMGGMGGMDFSKMGGMGGMDVSKMMDMSKGGGMSGVGDISKMSPSEMRKMAKSAKKGGIENMLPPEVGDMFKGGKAPSAGGAVPGVPPIASLAPSAGGGQSVDQSVKVDGGITVTINADKLEADSAKLLTDDIVAQLQRKLGSLRSEQDFRVGARPAAPA